VINFKVLIKMYLVVMLRPEMQTRGRNRFILYKGQDKMFSDDSYSVMSALW
jgi:hypothetical protein